MKGYVTCPDCGCRFAVDIPSEPKKRADMICLKCGHRWQYEGSLKSRVHCPKCGSTKNELNRKTFGKWHLENLYVKT
jgi:Primosomal protein N'' (replication factor Y) - superfamily II helicase